MEEKYQNSGFDNVHEGISVVPFSKNVHECKREFFFCKKFHEEKSAHVYI